MSVGPPLPPEARFDRRTEAGLAARRDPINPHGLREILDLLLAQILIGERQLLVHVLIGGLRDAHPAGLGQALQARREVDPVAVEVIALDDDVAEIDADPQLHPPRLGQRGVARLRALLDLDRALHRVHHAGELDQHAVAHQLHQTTLIFGEQRLDHLAAPLSEHRKRSGLVLAHEPAVADDVGGENRGEAAFVPGLAHCQCHRRSNIEDRYGRVLRQAWRTAGLPVRPGASRVPWPHAGTPENGTGVDYFWP